MRCTSLLGLLDGGADLSTYSLLDGAQAPGVRTTLRTDDEVEIFRLLGDSDATLVGPILVFHKRGPLCPALARLAAADSSSFYLSILQSRCESGLLVAHLATLANVSHADGSQWIMRYYDPRVLPHWASVLKPAQYALALSRVDNWYYISPDGSPGVMRGNGPPHTIYKDKNGMLFSEEQSAELLSKCAPLMLMNIISHERGEDIWRRDECERFEFTRRVLANAESNEITDFSDQKTFILLALAYGENFHESDAFLDMWDARGHDGLNAMILKMPTHLISEFGSPK